MPHMSPIMWTLIMIMTFLMIILTMTMIYFNITLHSPFTFKVKKDLKFFNWKW
uniref:ATP synthase F0 subunit 8 n=1 Tax=Altiverruca navicula TaxID=2099647 RepID=A0A343UTF1_9CRUS|nr:ATP synthase F0 subunit 8 [Altiverruca navicula]AVI15459.1 ATP synthase F0 subunit 8 [Altiverruca navicula]